MYFEPTQNMLMESLLLSETYYGKIDEMVECEGYFEEMKKWLLVGKNPNKCPAKDKFESTIAQTFGFEKVYFSIIAEERYANGFTMPFYASTNYMVDDHFFDLVKTGTGIKFKSSKGKVLYVYSYNYVIRNFTPAENMSIFMHELGHNFFLVKEQIQYAKINRGADLVYAALEYLRENNYSPTSFKEITCFLIEVSKELDNLSAVVYQEYKKFLSDKVQNKVIKKYEKTHGGLAGFFYSSLRVLKSVISSLIKIPFMPLYAIFFPIFLKSNLSRHNLNGISKSEKRNQDYNNEKFADNFALTYGYSSVNAALFSSDKWSETNKIKSKIPVLRVTNYMSQALQMIMFYFNDEHPNDARRVQFALDKVKYELANNKDELSPKQIAELETEVARIEKILKDKPYYKKGFDKILSKYWNQKDKAATVTYSDEEIYDFDKKLLKDHITTESYDIKHILTEDYDEIEHRLLTDKYNYIQEVINNIYD